MPRYARNGNVSLAYDVVGDGERDILVTFGWIGSFQSALEHPAHARWLERLATFGRVIMWDKRGTGLSERLPADRLPTLEERMDDMRVVMDAVGSERAATVGVSEGASLSAVFAASHPDRVTNLILIGGFARTLEDDDYEWGASKEAAEAFRHRMEETWGDNAGLLKLWAPSVADDPVAQEHWNRTMVFGATPATATAWLEMVEETDIRATLPAINVPTLVLHRTDDRIVSVEHARYMAEHIPDARYVELPGCDHLWWIGGDDLLDEIEAFLTGTTTTFEPDRILATVLFTDIVDSTRRAAELGDRRWRDLCDAHDRAVRRLLDALPRPRGEDARRRLPRHLRRSRPRDPLRERAARGRALGGPRGALRTPHRRGRAGRHRHLRDRREHRRARGRAGGRERGARLPDREGPGGRLRPRVRGPRRARPQGRARPMAAVVAGVTSAG